MIRLTRTPSPCRGLLDTHMAQAVAGIVLMVLVVGAVWAVVAAMGVENG